jgi:polo-like kinase 1
MVREVHKEQLEVVPSYAVSRFCDHSEKYGLGYLLADGTVGVCFNDLSRIVMDPFEEFAQYWETNQDKTPDIVKLDGFAESKKVILLRRFAESLKKTRTMFTLPTVRSSKYVPLKHVKYWMRTRDATLFRMDDRNVQVNFNDKLKLIIFAATNKMMCVSNIKDTAELIRIDGLAMMPGKDDERKRFAVAKAILEQMNAK